MSLYRTILRRAWQNAWSHKYLWFFGLFAALLGNGGEMELIMRGSDGSLGSGIMTGWKEVMETGIFSSGALQNIIRLAHDEPFSLFLALTTLFIIGLLVLFILWLSVVSQAAIVHNTAKEKHDKEHDFKDGIMMGIKKFWPVLGLNLVMQIITSLIFTAIAIPVFLGMSRSSLAGNLLFIALFIIFIPISIILSFVVKYAIAFTVIKGQKFLTASASAYRLFKDNWLVSIEMAIVLFAVNFLTGLALILVIMVLAVPFVFGVFLFSQAFAYFNFTLIGILGLVICLLLVVLTGAVLGTFQISAWTYLFMELLGKGGESKLARIFSKK